MITGYLVRLHTIFDSAQRYIPEKIEKNTNDSSLLVFVSQLKSPLDYRFNEELYFRSQEEYLKKQLGLNYTFDALQNINATQQDVEDNILYQRRFQNGLEWNILKDGYFDARSDLKLLPLEQAFSRELAQYQYSRKNIPVKMNQVIYWFNYKKAHVLDLRFELLNAQKSIIESLFFAKKIAKEFVISNQTRMAEIEAMKHIYASYNTYITPLFDSTAYDWEAPLFDLNYSRLAGGIAENGSLDSLTAELVRQSESQNKWFNEVRLKAYARHSYYDLLTADPAGRAFFSVGVGATVPLNFSHKEQNAIEHGKLYKQLESVHLAEDNQRIDLLNEAYEYRYQLKQYIVFHQKRISLLESIRQERVKAKLQDEDFNPLHALELMDDLYKVEIELLDLKQNLYLRLVKIHEKVQDVAVGELIVPLKLPNYFDFEDQTRRQVYLWSSAFEKHTNDFLVEYILYNQFDGVQLAISKEDPYKERKTQLIRDLKAKGVQTDLMIGQNSLLDSQQFKTEIEKMLKQFPLEMVHGVHLDIEPHTRDDWKTKQEELKNAYKYLLKETKSLCSTYNLKLSIDLPLSLDTVYVRELMEQADLVRFMCYENIKEEYLVRKLTPYLNRKEKIAVALRTEDFSTRNDMEFFAKTISNLTGINTLNFHDLNRLIELDKKSLKTDEEH
ncbi:MAG: hypothetical protein ACO1O6_06135 [Bacteroidota bacterium]